MNYLWRKHADPDWLNSHRDNLEWRFGNALAVIERPGKTRLTLEIVCVTKRESRKLLGEFGGSVKSLPRNWLQRFTAAKRGPLRIGSRLVVLRDPERTVTSSRPKQPWSIVIPAATAFGTGEHATTAMCLRFLEQITRRLQTGWTMFDAGTGTGILAIAGSCFGASRVVAIDNDAIACSAAKRNALTNGISNIDFLVDDVRKYRFTGKFDMITANLFSTILVEALPRWSRNLAHGGHLVLSGVLRNQESEVVQTLLKQGFTALEIRRRGKWIALHSQQP